MVLLCEVSLYIYALIDGKGGGGMRGVFTSWQRIVNFVWMYETAA
jgi:hypothetical protein